MQLDPNELHDLATFFSKRAPSAEVRYLIRQRTRIGSDSRPAPTPHSAWIHILEDASDAGKLHRLAYVISAEYADDTNLQQVCQLLAEKQINRGIRHTAMFGVPVTALLVTLFFWPSGDVKALQPQSVVTPATPVATLQPQSLEETPSPEVATLQPQSVKETTPDAPLVPNKAKAVPTPQKRIAKGQKTRVLPTVASAQPVPDHVPCDANQDQVIGYWYSGENAAGQQGDLVTIAKTVNVRADYPSHRNDYSARTPVQCVLFEGEQVRLSKEPILVAGERYWIPVTGADLVRS